MPRAALVLSGLIVAAACERPSADEDAALPEGALELRDVGFATPESVLHDSVADVYLVSNIEGGGGDRDDNGFISRVSPDGELLELKWIDGADEAVRLSAPKGMALVGERLLVTDIDTIRVFDRATGEPLASWGIARAVALNDLSAAPDGSVYVTDMGPGATPEGDAVEAYAAVYQVDSVGAATLLARGDALRRPNGVVATADGVFAVSFGGRRLFRVGRDGGVTDVATLPAERNDGLIALPDGEWLVSNWESRAVLRVGGDGSVTPLIEHVESPADIGHDAGRGRLLVPSFREDWLRIYPLP